MFTPIIYQIIPSSIYPNQRINWRIYNSVNKQELRIGEKICRISDKYQNNIQFTNIAFYYYQQLIVDCKVPNRMEAGYYKIDLNSP